MSELAASERLVREYLDAYNRADWDRVAALVAPGYVHHSNGVDYDLVGFTRRSQQLKLAIHGFTVEVEAVVADGGMVCVRWTARGTHAGSIYGERPSGHSLDLHGITMYRVDDARVAEDWQVMDERHLMIQGSPFEGFG